MEADFRERDRAKLRADLAALNVIVRDQQIGMAFAVILIVIMFACWIWSTL